MKGNRVITRHKAYFHFSLLCNTRVFPDYNLGIGLRDSTIFHDNFRKAWSFQKAEHKAVFDLATHFFLLKLFFHCSAIAQTILFKAPTITSKASHMAATIIISLICSHLDSLNSHLLILKYKAQQQKVEPSTLYTRINITYQIQC